MDTDTAGDWRLARAEARIELLERLVEERDRELAITHQQAEAVYAYLLELNNLIPGAVISASADGIVTRLNRGAHELLGYTEYELAGKRLSLIWDEADAVIQRFRQPGCERLRDEALWRTRDGERVPVMMCASSQHSDGELLSLVFVGLDLRDRRRLELELRHAQKLEALGQLSAGIAHEINTPMQFIGDNLTFLDDALGALQPVLDRFSTLPDRLDALGEREQAEALRAIAERADLGYVASRIPRAVQRALEGVARVSGIVEAMKSFSHPRSDHGPVDLAHAIRDTLIVSRNAYKYVADVSCDLDALPPVHANANDLNQVLLNLIVNAAHAIEARYDGSTQRGTISIRARRDADDVLLEIGDDGCGIPEAIRSRIFDPFFTTKEVGKGTGQGLAITRTIIVDRHRGSLSFTSEPGQGTTFTMRLPIGGEPTGAAP